MGNMAATQFIKARLTPDMKRRVAIIAERECVTESAWLKRLVIRELLATGEGNEEIASMSLTSESSECRSAAGQQREQHCHRVNVRLRPEAGNFSKRAWRRAGCGRRPMFPY